MRIAKIITNDIVNGNGINVSLFMQGCPHCCPGCFNPETWDPRAGIEVNSLDLIQLLIDELQKNGIKRNLSILGGEPLAPYNIGDTAFIVTTIRDVFPDIKITLWTGYVLDQVSDSNGAKDLILNCVDTIVDGPFQMENKDSSLYLRGSSNQRILHKDIDF